MGRIAIVDQNLKLHITDVHGTNVVTVDASGQGQTWPVWSPSGERILFSSASAGSNGRGHLGIYSWNVNDASTHLVYRNELGTDAIAKRTPHYSQWSPNSFDFSFVAQTMDGGLSLFLGSLDPTEQPKRVLTGKPMFSSWSPNGAYLIVHSGFDHFLVDREDGDQVKKIPSSSSMYAAPSWSPVETLMALLIEEGEQRQSLVVSDAHGRTVTVLTEFYGAGSFSWAPDGRSIALLRNIEQGSKFYPGLWLVDSDGKEERQITDEPLICFYWSPDGSKIACVTPSGDTNGWVRWTVLDLVSGQVQHLNNFLPTTEQLMMFLFFDQYYQTHNPWSPDGQTLIFAGIVRKRGEQQNISQDDGPYIFVLDPKGSERLIPVAQGPLGVWSRGDSGVTKANRTGF
jgi:TolB protein